MINDYVNKKNCHIWDEVNLHAIHQVTMHPQKVIGLYFFENDVGESVTINDERYRSVISNLFWPELNNMYMDDKWFQQDGVTCHTANATMDILHERFEGMVLSSGGDMNWPPRSCDLTPLDFFLWDFLKSQVYANKPQSIDVLKVNIT